MSVNKATILGRLGADPETRSFPNGGSICSLRVATSERWKDKQTGEAREATEWHRVVLNGRTGEIAQQYLRKGSEVYIEGRIHTRKWQDQNGQDKYATEIRGSVLRLIGGNGSGGQQQAPQQAQNKPASQTAGPDYGDADYYDDDIPF